MSTIIGLGSAGCNIADEFAKYPQYHVYKIDAGLHGENCFDFPEQPDHENYEKNCPPMDEFFKDVSGEVLFILGGSGTISGASLRILAHLKHCKVGILYIKPDYELLSETKRLQERVVFGILQEYARSGVFERIYLVLNQKLEEVLGEVPIAEYYDKLNSLLVTTIHMLNIFKNTEPVTNTFSVPVPSARILTLGVFSPETGEEKMFFPLDIEREKRYYYGINEEVLKTDGSLFKKIKERIKEEKTRASYGIYQTQYNKNYGYIISYSSKIQLDKLEISEYTID
jgi:hypothetical protein